MAFTVLLTPQAEDDLLRLFDFIIERELARDSGARALVTRDKLVLKLGRRPVIADRFAILTPERLQTLLP